MIRSIALFAILVHLVLPTSFGQEAHWVKILPIQTYWMDMVICPNGHIFVTFEDTVFRSTDGGDHWRSLSLGPGSVKGFSQMGVDTEGTIYGLAGGGLWRSTNDGEGWTPCASVPLGSRGELLRFALDHDGRIFFAACYGGVWRSTDRGESWVQVLDSVDVHGIVLSPLGEIIASPPGGRVLAGSAVDRVSQRKSHCTTDGGRTWSEYGYGFTSMGRDPAGAMVAGSGITSGGWPVGNFEYLLRSTDNGKTWESCLKKITFDILTDRTYGLIVAGSGGIVRSSDGGLTWSDLNDGLLDTTVIALERNAEGVLFAGTREGVYRFEEKTLSVTPGDAHTPTICSLDQNYPNPCNPTTDIRYRISEFADVRLAVYDLLGREVAVLVDGKKAPGTYQVRFDGKGLPSGVYFYRLHTGSYAETRKMMLVR